MKTHSYSTWCMPKRPHRGGRRTLRCLHSLSVTIVTTATRRLAPPPRKQAADPLVVPIKHSIALKYTLLRESIIIPGLCVQNYRDTRTLEHYPTPPPTILPRSRSTNNTTRGAAHAIDQKSRRGANEENVHQKEMLEDPLIIVRGEELVASDPKACEHHPAAWSGPAPADRNRTAGAAVAPSTDPAAAPLVQYGHHGR